MNDTAAIIDLQKYNYVLAQPFCGTLKHLFLEDDYYNKWGEIVDGDQLTIYAGYAWDGCSGYVAQGDEIDWREGMPVTTKESDPYTQTVTAALKHDFIYQFLKDISLTTSLDVRKCADMEFRDTLKHFNFKHYKLYYFGVRVFGRFTRSVRGMIHTWSSRG